MCNILYVKYFSSPWGKYFYIMAVLKTLLLQITNIPNTYNLIILASSIPGPPSPAPNQIQICTFLHMMPDDFFKKPPKFGKINFGTAKVHKCHVGFYFNSQDNFIIFSESSGFHAQRDDVHLSFFRIRCRRRNSDSWNLIVFKLKLLSFNKTLFWSISKFTINGAGGNPIN